MEYLPDLTKNNISLYTIPAFWLITMTGRMYSASVYASKTKDEMDGRAPRDFTSKISQSQQLDAATKASLLRAEASVANGFENFGPFTAAVVAVNAAKLDPMFANGITLAYLASRAVYNYVYITNDTKAKASVRGLTYIGGVSMLFAMFIKAGQKFF